MTPISVQLWTNSHTSYLMIFSDCMPVRHLDYYTDAVDDLLQTRLDLSKRNIAGYGFVKTLGT